MTRPKVARILATCLLLCLFPIVLVVASWLFLEGYSPTWIVLFLITVFVAQMIWAVEIDRTRHKENQER